MRTLATFFCAQRSSLDGCSVRRLIGMTWHSDALNRAVTGQHYTCELVELTAALGVGVKMDDILMVTFHTPYDHGS